MSRVAMRSAVAAYLENAELTYVGKVFAARPEILSEDAYETNMFAEAAPSANGSSAVLVVNIPSDHRQRRADTGRGAVNDQWTFNVALEVFFASTAGEAVKAQEDYDVVIDGIVTLIRADANLGDPSVVWSAGEYDVGIQHFQGEPYTDADGLTVFISGEVTIQAMAWIAGQV